MPDDDDEVDELEQWELWKARELARVKRERDERHAEEREKKEIERRRGLTDAQRKAEDDAFNKHRLGQGGEQVKWKFLQKYYHKGAYFQDEDQEGNAVSGPVMHQDFGQATGGDALGDKAAMPKVMQVKNFGKRSQVKWTHLTAEDTSSKDSLWGAAGSSKQAQGYAAKMAGSKASNDFARPSAKRRKPGL
jgi:microfibrillar-associated protein 1